MALPLKTKGLEELYSLKRRVKRQKAMERISKSDHDYLVSMLDDVEAKIVRMQEGDDKMRGVFGGW